MPSGLGPHCLHVCLPRLGTVVARSLSVAFHYVPFRGLCLASGKEKVLEACAPLWLSASGPSRSGPRVCDTAGAFIRSAGPHSCTDPVGTPGRPAR